MDKRIKALYTQLKVVNTSINMHESIIDSAAVQKSRSVIGPLKEQAAKLRAGIAALQSLCAHKYKESIHSHGRVTDYDCPKCGRHYESA